MDGLYTSAGPIRRTLGTPKKLSALVKTYLRLSLRGRTLGRWEQRTRSRSIAVALVIYAFIGASLSFPALTQGVFALSFVSHATTMAFLAMILVSETPELLFSKREADVIGHRPVEPGALVLAKGAGFCAFALLIAGALNAVPALLGTLARGSRPWFALVHLTSTALLALLCTAVAVLACALLLRVVPRERFDAIASWGQLVVLVGFILSNQFLLRLSRVSGIENRVWFWAFPPGWMASFDAWLTGQVLPARGRWLALAGVVVPLLTAALALGRLGRGLGESLDPAHEGAALRARSDPDRSGRRWRALWKGPLGWWVKQSAERAAFELTVGYLLRDRRVRLRVVPAVAIAISFPLLAAFWGERGGARIYVPMSVAMFGTLSTQLLAGFEISPEPEAAQIFFIAPLRSGALVFHGVRKAFLALTTFPLLVLDAVLVAALVPDGLAAGRLALPLLPLLPLMSMVPGLTGRYLPLSRGPRMGSDSAASLAVSLVTVFVSLGAIGIGWVVDAMGWLWPALGAETVVLAALHPALLWVVGRRQGHLSSMQ